MAKKKKKKAKKSTTRAAKQPDLKAGADAQEGSLLFGLPQELRDEIYSHLFFSTRFTYGDRPTGRITSVRTKSAPNALALLLTCRRARDEIGDMWVGQVLFSFEGPESMLDKLTAIPAETLAKIRHLRVRGRSLMLSFPGDDDDCYYRLAYVLKLLPYLRLDRLTVLGDVDPKIRYESLNQLILQGDGWKELHFISHNSAMLGYATLPGFFDPGDRYMRNPQPAHWQSLLADRDGDLSMPSVNIYRSTLPGCAGSVTNPGTRERYEQKLPDGEAAQRRFGLAEDADLMADGERNKEMLIIAKRGTGVDYGEKPGSPFLEGDIRREMPGKTWKEIRAVCIDIFFEDEDWSFREREEDLTEIDSYKVVGDYVWTPLHVH